MSSEVSNIRPAPDQILIDIADYAASYVCTSEEAIDTARYNLMDALGCGLLALRYRECTKLLGPVVPGATLNDGARVPGTDWQLDPVQAAFNLGAMIRWLDFNDTWLAAEWGHPSDNLGGILTLADYLTRTKRETFTVSEILNAMIKAHEIQGILGGTLELESGIAPTDVTLYRDGGDRSRNARWNEGSDHQRPCQRLDRWRRAARLSTRA